jgi:hypothetical protein
VQELTEVRREKKRRGPSLSAFSFLGVLALVGLPFVLSWTALLRCKAELDEPPVDRPMHADIEKPAAQPPAVSCRVHSIELSPAGDGTIPENLQFLGEQLQAQEFSRYRGFRLLETEDFALDFGALVEHEFESSHTVALRLLDIEEDRIQLHVEIAPLLETDMLVKDGQLVLIPIRRGGGLIVFVHRCKS